LLGVVAAVVVIIDAVVAVARLVLIALFEFDIGGVFEP
jgi:hypothetical protein